MVELGRDVAQVDAVEAGPDSAPLTHAHVHLTPLVVHLDKYGDSAGELEGSEGGKERERRRGRGGTSLFCTTIVSWVEHFENHPLPSPPLTSGCWRWR